MGAKIGVEIAHLVGPPGKSAKGKYDEGSDEEEASEDGDQEAKEGAAEEFQSAVKDGSPADVVEAFEKLRDICG